jgi:hypothetical protein
MQHGSIARMVGGMTALCLTLATAPAMAGSYVYTTLDLVGQTGTYAWAINDSGQVVGSSGAYAFVWDNGTYTSVSPVGTGGASASLTAINANGIAAGTYLDPNSKFTHRYAPFTYNIATASVSLITSSAKVTASVGGINAHNVVVGFLSNLKSDFEGFMAKGSKAAPSIKDPNADANGTQVGGISDAGMIAGTYFVSPGVLQGFTYAKKVYTNFTPPGSLSTIVPGVTPAGVIFGAFYTNLSTAAQTGFVDNNGSFTNYNYPGATYTQVSGIGPSGEAVGYWGNVNSNNESSFVFVGGAYDNISFPGAQTTQVNGINASGTLVGTYTDSSSVAHGFVAVCPAGESPCTE